MTDNFLASLAQLFILCTTNYSKCGASHCGIVTHPLKGGTVFLFSVGSRSKMISIWTFCSSIYSIYEVCYNQNSI